MKKVNFFAADKSFSGDVAQYLVKVVWRAEYKSRLEAAILKDKNSIMGLENCRKSCVMTEEQVDKAQEDLRAHIEALEKSYNEIINEWTRFKPSEQVKSAYKAYKAGESEQGFVTMFKEYGLELDASAEVVQTLCKAVLGDSGAQNSASLRSLVNGGNVAVEVRGQAEFCKIVYRRLADYLFDAGTIRCVGNKVRGGGEDVAELLLEIPEFTKRKYAPKAKKSAK